MPNTILRSVPYLIKGLIQPCGIEWGDMLNGRTAVAKVLGEDLEAEVTRVLSAEGSSFSPSVMSGG